MNLKTTSRILGLMVLVSSAITSCRKPVETENLPGVKKVVRGFFGDKEGNTVKCVNVTDFTLESTVPTGHQVTYTADKVADLGKLYVVNRGSNAIDVMDAKTMKITNTIVLDHYPRSAEAVNKTLGLAAVTGMNRPMVSIIDIYTDQVVATVGSDEFTYPVGLNNSGSHACGHPFWLDAHHFILPDRGNMKLECYKIEQVNGTWETTLVSSIDTPSPVHQIYPSKGNYQGEANYFYASAEGVSKMGAANVFPSVLKLHFTPESGLLIEDQLVLDDDPVEDMGLHHGDFHPFEKLIYVGSRQGKVYVIDYENMILQSTIEAGKGVGHVKMIKKKHLAVAINHSDVFLTIIDLDNNEKVADVVVSESTEMVGQTTLQAHPKWYVNDDGSKFYSFATYDGVMYELDLNTYEITRTLDIGGQPAQGSFMTVMLDE